MGCSMPGLPVHHQLLEFTQTHIHWVSDAIQLSHPVIAFSSHIQSFPASGSFQISQFFTSGSQRIVLSVSTSVLPMNIQDWFPLGWTVWISLQSKRLFSYSLFAIKLVSSAYLRLFICFPSILIPACASSSPASLMMYAAYTLNMQPWHAPFPIWNQSVVPCPVLTVSSWPA